jgi:hypothetical protein
MVMTSEEVREYRAKKLKEQGGSGGNYFGIEGDTTVVVRLGPPWSKESESWRERLYHGRYPDKILCGHNETDKEGNPKKCKACGRYKKLKGDKSKRARKLSGLLKQKGEYLWNVLACKTKKTDEGVKIVGYKDGKFKVWRLAAQWSLDLIDLIADEEYRKKSALGITAKKSGRPVRVERVGSGMKDTKYKFKALSPSPISKDSDKMESLLESLNDLDALCEPASEEEMAAFVRKMEKKSRHASDDDEDEDEGDDEEESSDEDEDEEESSDEDEDEDEEKSSKKKKKKSKKSEEDSDEDEDESDDDEEDEDEDEDEDEEESSSKKKKKKKKKSDEDEDDDDDDDVEKVFKEMKDSIKKKKKKKKDEDEDEDDEDEDEDED